MTEKKSKKTTTTRPAHAHRHVPAHAPVVIDVAGLSLSADDRRRLQNPLVGGLILFGRNWQNREQLTQLVAQIKAVREDVIVCVDHEGGRVQRFKTDGFTHLPAMGQLGKMWMQDGGKGRSALAATDAATAWGYILGAELRACGVDLSFTPVLDLDYGNSDIIGDRAFHSDPRVVSVLAKSLMHGLLLSGMHNCGKHFPGHGHVAADSHVAIPVDKRSLKTILTKDAKPYEWLGLSLSSVMPAHVIYPQVDDLPAGFSKRWLQEILRGQMGYDGVIFSDDLSMEGASVVGDHTQGAIAALRAGCDMVLLCNQSLGEGAAVDALLEGLMQAQRQSQWQPSADSERRRLSLLPDQTPCFWDDLMRSPRYLKALTTLENV